MPRLLPLAAAALVAGLAACGGRAATPTSPAAAAGGPAPPASVEGGAAPGADRADDSRPRGRPAGIRTIDINGQRTYWVEHCPTDSSSPLREPCSMTRADLGAE